MRQWLISALAHVLLTTAALAQIGGLSLPGPGPIAVAGASFSGLGDVNSGAIGYWGLNAYTAAYAAANGKLVNVFRISDSHTCDVLSATNGGLGLTASCSTGGDNGQSASSFCNATTCHAVTLYDQTGANACTGTVACNITQATDANRPILAFNCINTTLPCLQTTLASAQVLNSTATMPITAQPFTIGFVAARTGSFTTFQDMFGDSAGVFEFGWVNSANTLRLQAGAGVNFSNAACGDSTVRSFQGVVNGTSSAIVCGPTASGALNPSTGGFGAGSPRNINVFNGGGNNPATTTFAAIWWYAAAWNSTQYGNAHTNVCGYWGCP